eukprot:3404695-Alexandrium_andersonii.AAC.1
MRKACGRLHYRACSPVATSAVDRRRAATGCFHEVDKESPRRSGVGWASGLPSAIHSGRPSGLPEGSNSAPGRVQ